jgi:hypothetical protein
MPLPGAASLEAGERKVLVRVLQRRWHPDKFSQRFAAKLSGGVGGGGSSYGGDGIGGGSVSGSARGCVNGSGGDSVLSERDEVLRRVVGISQAINEIVL